MEFIEIGKKVVSDAKTINKRLFNALRSCNKCDQLLHGYIVGQ